MLPKLAILCLTSAFAYSATSVDEESSLDKTVEDVETLRVLVTNALSTSVAGANVGWRGWKLEQRALRPNRGNDAKDDGDADDDVEAKDDASDEKDGDSNDGDLRLAWLRTLEPRVYTDSNGGYLLGNVYGNAESPTSYTRAFYAPGIGAWIDTNLKVPYAFVESKDGASGSESRADDDWNAAKRTLKGGSQGGASSKPDGEARRAMLTLDSNRIEAAIDAVAEVLREHGHRIRGLESDENVVVALKIEGEGYAGEDGDQAAWNTLSLSLRYYSVLSVRSDRLESKSIVIRAPKSLIDAAGNGDLDAAAFRKRLAITRY